MSLIEKLDGVLALALKEETVCCGREECGGECGNDWYGMKPTDESLYEATAFLRAHGPAIRQAVIDAERYQAVRAICCSAEGPSDELASAWMTGDEAAMDLAADMARATGEGEGHDPR